MARYLIDLNLPYRFSLWVGADFIHVRDLGETWSDSRIWSYAKANELVIVSKDVDFSDRALMSSPPPRVVHVRYGNMKMSDFHGLIRRHWPEIAALCTDHRLVTVFEDRIEAIG
jgi:predicted nuclease of predicted toxin-antitoxin system